MTAVTGGATEMLPIPGVRTLPDDQLRGRACAWCGSEEQDALRPLGPRVLATPYRTDAVCNPRGCVSCVRREALRVLAIHRGTCTRREYCPAHTALQRLSQGVGL